MFNVIDTIEMAKEKGKIFIGDLLNLVTDETDIIICTEERVAYLQELFPDVLVIS